MSLMIAVRIARRELRGGLKGFRVFLACLALGVAAIAGVGSVRDAIQTGIASEGATILGGDAKLTFTYRYADPEERAWIEGASDRVSEVVDFRSMAVVGAGQSAERGLTQIKAVDGEYPIYGAPILAPDIPLADVFAGDGDLPGAAMDPVLIERLGLSIGEVFRLGTQDFVLMSALVREPDSATGGFALGPRTLVQTAALDNAGLLAPGTLFETEYRLALSESANLDALSEAAETALSGSGVRWQDRRNGAPGVTEFVDRLASFLVLVGLAGLAVGGVGVAAAVRAYLWEKTAVIAVLKTLGAESRTVFQTYLLQIGALALIGILVGVALGGVIPVLFEPVIAARLPLPVDIRIYPAALAEAALYGALATMVFTMWPLARTEDVRATTLFRDQALGIRRLPRSIWIVLTVGALVVLVAVAALLSGLIALTVWTALGLLGAFAALLLAAMGVRRLAGRLARSKAFRGPTGLRHALGSVGGPGGEATSVVLSLGLGLTVLATIGQIDANLRGAIARDLPEVAPSFFVVDIQTDQLQPLRDFLGSDDRVTDVQSAPMLRGIITRINGEEARSVAGDHWVLEGDRGITYSTAQPENAVVTDGAWWPEDYAGPPLVSFASEEGAELGLELGDLLTINVLGRDIVAEVANFREVDFSTAGIGFILSMNASALAGAPHSHIATIYGDASADAAILRGVSETFPNVTAIRVRDAIDRVSEILAGIAAAVTYGALATLVTGAVVLVGTAAAGERARTYEAAILKTLGASRGDILVNFALRSAILGAAAGFVAVVAGMAAGWGVMTFVMETDYIFEPVSALAIVLGGLLLTLLAGVVFAWRPLAARPATVLRAQE
ncbi:MAG: FtsX-like permease family protein [Pseudomonadota bacterium]